jgi:hypothetical protein
MVFISRTSAGAFSGSVRAAIPLGIQIFWCYANGFHFRSRCLTGVSQTRPPGSRSETPMCRVRRTCFGRFQ